jgi:cell division protein FtsB
MGTNINYNKMKEIQKQEKVCKMKTLNLIGVVIFALLLTIY